MSAVPAIDRDAARLPLPELVGERGLLRALRPADTADLQRHADDAEVARHLFDGFPRPYTLADAQAWCEAANGGAHGHVWGIEADGAVVGCIGLEPGHGRLRCGAELGYWLGRAHWGRGLARDAVRQVVDWAFAAQPGLARIAAHVAAGHEASQAVLRDCGFVREGVLRQSALKDGRAIDRVLWAAYRPTDEARPADIDRALAMATAAAMERA